MSSIVFEDLLKILLRWLPTLLLLAGAAAVPTLFKVITGRILKKLEGHLPEWLHILLHSYHKPATMMLRASFLYAALFFLPVLFNGSLWQQAVGTVFHISLVALAGWGGWTSAPLCRLLLRSAENHLDVETNRTMGRFFENIYRALVILLAAIMILDLCGVPVTGLLTGAGVAGLAVSLAAQSTLSNLIAGITLVMEHPFGIGDYVVLGSYEGTVEDISFRSTRLRTPDNVVITVENSKICAEYIQNVTDRKSRLWQFSIGVRYDTPSGSVKSLCAHLEELLKGDPSVLSDKVTVYLSEFADSSINITARLYVDTVAYNDFLRLKDRLNLRIMDLVKAEGCDFAFPSASIYMEQT